MCEGSEGRAAAFKTRLDTMAHGMCVSVMPDGNVQTGCVIVVKEASWTDLITAAAKVFRSMTDGHSASTRSRCSRESSAKSFSSNCGPRKKDTRDESNPVS